MIYYKVTERQLPEHNQVFAEHPKFGHYRTPYVTWVCLVTGENQSKYFALSNLESVAPVRSEQPAVITTPVQTVKPTIVTTSTAWDDHAFHVEFMAMELESDILDSRFAKDEARTTYTQSLNDQIKRALVDFNVYPSEVFLQIANGILELAKREVEIRIAVAESELDTLEAVA